MCKFAYDRKTLSAHFWVGFFIPKTPLIFNTYNTCNKQMRINLNIKTNVTNTI